MLCLADTLNHLMFLPVASQYELRKLQSEGLQVLTVADYDARTLLHLAAAEGKQKVLRYILRQQRKQRQWNTSPQDRWGRTPLDDANAGEHTACIKLLKVAEESAGTTVMNVSRTSCILRALVSTAWIYLTETLLWLALPQAADVLLKKLSKRNGMLRSRFLSAVVDDANEAEEAEEDETTDAEDSEAEIEEGQSLGGGRAFNRVDSIDHANALSHPARVL
jgi:hypothetical protein